MFKGLTQRAQRILTLDAQEEARRFNSEQLLPEHIVIALLKDGAGIACKALMCLRIDLVEFLHVIENALPRLAGSLVFGDVPPSKRTRTMLEIAAEEAQTLKNDYIGTEHLLLAAMRESNSQAHAYLDQRSVDTDMLRVVVKTTFTRGESPRWEGEVHQFVEGFQSYMFHPEYKTGDFKLYHQNRGKNSQSSGMTVTLDEFSRDLTALARAGKLDPLIGRRKEIDRAVRILARRTKNNPVLVGEPGVGKTAIVEGLARFLVSPNVPEALAGRRILSLDMGAVVAGTKYRGEFEERLKKIMREISRVQNVILFIDEIHTVIGAGGAEGTIDASNMLKPALSRGEVQCVGATTLAEYRKHFERDAALERRFQAIMVEEPTVDETIDILKGLQSRYENHHRVVYAPEAVVTAVRLAQRYIPGRFMPDKAIDIIDEAGAMRKLEFSVQPPELADIETEIQMLTKERSLLVSSRNYDRAAEIRDRVRRLRSRLEVVREAWERAAYTGRVKVNEGDIRRVVSEATGIPLMHLEEQESRRLLKIEDEIHRAVIGQDDAVNRIASSIRRSRAGISSPRRPMGSFIFLGPTGVGKTLLAKRLAAYLFGSEEALVRIDMSDFMEKHNASRLTGAPPGYIGYEEGGILTEKIRKNPYRVILFDEIEKAHRDVFNLLLQMLEEGELKDSLGHTVNFRNTVIIMTSNAGVREISRDSRLGFGAGSGIMSIEEIQAAALSELRRLFNPEFINRIDDIVVFHTLNEQQVEAILDIQIGELSQRLAEQGFFIRISPAARRLLIKKGWDPKYGARPMRRTIQKELEDPLSHLLLEGNYSPGVTFSADLAGDTITIHPKPGESGVEPEAAASGTAVISAP
ncbi:MAG: ATP-dependent Clp protease ATP-binding subunit [Treponema sp.]|nr:ATP-dependent Clp protease ATP-binding subunit [Treponema sp.]